MWWRRGSGNGVILKYMSSVEDSMVGAVHECWIQSCIHKCSDETGKSFSLDIMYSKTYHLNGSAHYHGFWLFQLILVVPTLHFTGQGGDVPFINGTICLYLLLRTFLTV